MRSPARALPESPSARQGCPGPLDRLQLLGAAARLVAVAQVPALAKAGTELAEELARVTLGQCRVVKPVAVG